MTSAPDVESARPAWRQLAATVIRSVLSVALMVAAYYRAPLDKPLDASAVLWLGLIAAALVAALSWQLRSILLSDTPRLKALETVTIGLPLLLLCYAAVYAMLSTSRPASFTEVLGRTDALYFTVTVFATVGFGDIAPTSEVARIVTTTQMVTGIVVLGVVARLLVGAVKAADDRKTAGIRRDDVDRQSSGAPLRDHGEAERRSAPSG